MPDPAARRQWSALAAAAVVQVRAAGVDPATISRLREHLLLLRGVDEVVSGEAVSGRVVSGDDIGPPPEGATAADPWSLGRLHEQLLDEDHRHRHGVHYTPAAAAATLVARVLAPLDLAPSVPYVCDPSCGGGAFLLAAADHLRNRGIDPVAVLGALHGLDIDPVAVETARVALVVWAAAAGVRGPALVDLAELAARQVVVADALVAAWPGEGRLHAVVGNPPFAGQLARSTARDDARSAIARALLGGSASGYADTAGLFLVRATTSTRPGGRISLIQPLSFLASRDAGAVRRRLEQVAVLEEVWLAGDRLFGAAVDVCAPVVRVGDPFHRCEVEAPVVVCRGLDAEAVGAVSHDRLARAGTWAPVVAVATGVPTVDLDGRERLGTIARATAGFRDEFYALVPFVDDAAGVTDDDAPVPPVVPAGHARLVTAGLVEPARVLWGQRATRFAGRRLLAPVVDVARLRRRSGEPDGNRQLAVWADARLRPKVVVAAQTRTVEAAVDDDGSWWPSVPVISVTLDPERDSSEERWLVAAALMAPPVAAWAAERTAGTALAAHALKIPARQIVEVPLPVDRDAWREGAQLLKRVASAPDEAERAAVLAAAGRALTAAHALPVSTVADVLQWWAERAGCSDQL